MGLKFSIQARTQSLSSRASVLNSKGLTAGKVSLTKAITGALSTSASYKAVTLVSDQTGVVPISGSKIGWSSASIKVTDAALASIKASESGSTKCSGTVALI